MNTLPFYLAHLAMDINILLSVKLLSLEPQVAFTSIMSNTGTHKYRKMSLSLFIKAGLPQLLSRGFSLAGLISFVLLVVLELGPLVQQ